MHATTQPDFRRPDFSGVLLDDAERHSLDAILREGSKSFAAAARLLPRRIRTDVTALYAFCRISDDLVDEGDDVAGALALLRGRLDLMAAGRPLDHPVDRAFADLLARYAIPEELPLALLEGYRFDAEGRAYETIDDVLGYCARVASSVGVMMTLLMGARDPATLARACDLGLAMQLTNIARDVGEDARNGRCYLPAAWMRAAGIHPAAFLAAPEFTPALGSVVSQLLAVAAHHYSLADLGVERLPRDVRLAIRGARLIYSDIGRVIARQGFDSVSRRAYTSKARKVWLLTRAYLTRCGDPSRGREPVHPSARFLVDAVIARGERARDWG